MFSKKDIHNGFIPFPMDRAQFYKKQGLWHPETHAHFLNRIQKQYGQNVAIQQDQKQLTYAALYAYARQFGAHLADKGIQENDFVLLQAPNVIEFFIALFGLYVIGARPVFCLHGHGAYEIESIAKTSRAVGYIKIIDSTQDSSDAVEMTNQFVAPNFNLWLRVTLVSHETLDQSFPMFANTQVNEHLMLSGTAEQIAFLQLSGGTTGIPKLIARTHADYLYSVRLSVAVAQLNAQTKQLIVLPVMHNFTMSSPGFLGAFHVGATIVLAKDTSPRTCLSLIERYGITQVSVVPAIINIWLHSPLINDYDLSSLQVIQVGGAKLLPVLANQIMDQLAVKLQQVYGMAEGLVNFTHLDDPRDTIIYTQGKRLSPYDEIIIVDDEENIVSEEVVGQILTKGPYTINGYYNSATINQQSFTTEGFYKTGDLGFIDKNNNIVVTGRIKEQINRAGEKLTPSEIENFILEHPAIQDVTVLGVEDPLLGEHIKALIILKDGYSSLSLKEIRAFLMQKNIAHYKIPDALEVVKDFKYTHVGKVHKQKLKTHR